MADTVLSIGEKLSDDCGLPRFTNLIGNTSQDARRIVSSIRDGLLDDVFLDRDWEKLKVEATISVLGGGVTTYTLPTDLDRIVNDTIWDSTNSRKVHGPVDLREWQEYNEGFAQLAGLELVCRIQGDQANNVKVITFYPDTSASTVTLWYISNKPVISSGSVLKTDISADDDEFVVPPRAVKAAAKWRLLRSLGMSFQDERIEYTSILDSLSSDDSGGKTINMGGRSRHDTANIPEAGYGS